MNGADNPSELREGSPAAGGGSEPGGGWEEEVRVGAEGDAGSWKHRLRRDFERWLAAVEEGESLDEDGEDGEGAPDLYSFYEQLAAMGVESRKANRRTAEAISQWGDVLARFEGALAPLREVTVRLAEAQGPEGALARGQCLMLVELLDRLKRVAVAFETPPAARSAWWGGRDGVWRKAWGAQAQAVEIVVGHWESLLKAHGVTRIEALGRAFDPTLMAAVAVEAGGSGAVQTVTEEVAAGYLYRGELLRAAQVKVSRASG